jgi:hypothetical protein
MITQIWRLFLTKLLDHRTFLKIFRLHDKIEDFHSAWPEDILFDSFCIFVFPTKQVSPKICLNIWIGIRASLVPQGSLSKPVKKWGKIVRLVRGSFKCTKVSSYEIHILVYKFTDWFPLSVFGYIFYVQSCHALFWLFQLFLAFFNTLYQVVEMIGRTITEYWHSDGLCRSLY